MNSTSNYDCPIPAAHDKFTEAHYFLHQIIKEFHEPDPFRWNLNAFLQALRSVPVLINNELQKQSNFKKWYSEWIGGLKEDELIQKFGKGRDILVHNRMLRHKSQVEAGLFRGTVMKMAFQFPIDVNVRSEDVLRQLMRATMEDTTDIENPTNELDELSFFGTFIDKEHSAIGEQLGVRRTWIVEELGSGDEDIVILCHRAWSRMSRFVSDAHQFAGAQLPPLEEMSVLHNITRTSILLETDLNPTLIKQWEWE